MKKIAKKIAISLIIVLVTLFSSNLIFGIQQVSAETDTSLQEAYKDPSNVKGEQEKDALANIWGVAGNALDGLVGIVTWIPRALITAVFSLFRVLVGGITAIGGTAVWDIEGIIFTDAVSDKDNSIIGSQIFSVDFFNIDDSEGTFNTLRKNVAYWYYSLRNLSIVILLMILLYVGIRMIISTVASEEAKYKKMFKDWVVSLLMVFIMHYIMVFTIEINKVLVSILYNAMNQDSYWDSYIGQLLSDCFHWSFTVGTGSMVVYGLMIGITFVYLFMYVKRMLTVGFLIIISPLITVTYAIDKMRDGKSQALDTWLKEFVFNVLIQPFHCIIYIVFVSSAMKMMSEAKSMASAILAVIMILFMNQAEKIVKKIFNFSANSLADMAGSTAMVATGLKFMKNAGNSASKKNVDTKKIPNMKAQGQDNFSGGTNKAKNTSNVANNNMNATEQDKSEQKSSEGTTAPQTYATGGTQNVANTGGGTKAKKKRNIPKAIKGVAATTAKGATYIALATMGAAMGKEGIMSGVAAASAINKGFTAKLNRRSANKLVKANESKFAGAYKNFQEKTGRNNEQMEAYTQNLLDGKYDIDKMSKDEYDYYSYVRQMKQTYDVVGENNINERMMDTISMINEGSIDPDYSGLSNANEQQIGPEPKTEPKQENESPIKTYSDNVNVAKEKERIEAKKAEKESTPKKEEQSGIITNGTWNDVINAREGNDQSRRRK